MKGRLTFTLVAWPVIALAAIGLCYLTQLVAGCFGVALGEQMTVKQMHETGVHAWQVLTTLGIDGVFADKYACKFVINLGAVLVLAPVLEEFLFRYLLFGLPVRRLPAVRESRICVCALAGFSAVLFSLAHYLLEPGANNAFVALAFFGWAQCWLYRKTSRLWCPMLNHALFNLTSLVLLFIVPEQGAVP